MNAAIEDIEFLVSSGHRLGVLEALSANPCNRNELRAATDASSPTIGRILNDFKDRNWIDRDGHTYQLTGLGEFVADRLEEFMEAMTVERRLRTVSPWLPHGLDGFSVELLTDAVVSYPGPGYPYEPLARHIQLLEAAERIQGFGMVMLKASILEAYFDAVVDGLEAEMIYPPHVFETMVSWNPERVGEALDRDNYTVMLHDDLPTGDWCGICLSDKHLSICCYEPDTGMLQSLVDTDDPEANEWGESIMDQYRAEARPLDEAEDLSSAGILR